ncbi:hypothetical protein [Hyphomonas pacifica]|uniref:hypothetical protein n=1 Tax=Hyphomonas pacifica TaxID=1280941 RepID=UPI0011BF0CA5|nr:hypothetical protein [Hyphomonas pacifica]
MEKSNNTEAAQVEETRRALKQKSQSETEVGHEHLDTRTSHDGQVDGAQKGAPKNGILDAKGNRPVLERSRKVR